jgi:hypothetical protein
MTRMRLAVAFKHRETGEQRVITAELSRPEILDVLREAARRGDVDAGWPPLENRYAIDRAARGLAPEFEYVTKAIRRIPPLEVICNDEHGQPAGCVGPVLG